MTGAEIQAALDEMVILIDTREQDNHLLRERISRMDSKTVRKKLNFGDYSCRVTVGDQVFDFSNEVAIERKYALDELAMCFCQQRKRFKAEFERAKEAGAKIYLLIENCSYEKVYGGKYRSQMAPQALIASILAWMARYDCSVVYCAPETTGRLIRDILYREAKERLEKYID